MSSVQKFLILLIIIFVAYGQEQSTTNQTTVSPASVTVQVEPDAVKHPEDNQLKTPTINSQQTEVKAEALNIVEQSKQIVTEQKENPPQSLPPQPLSNTSENLNPGAETTQNDSGQQIQSKEIKETVSASSSEKQAVERDLISSPDSPSYSLQNLTEEQKKKMLQEQAIFSAFHKDPDGDFNVYANMTTEQLVELEKKMHEEARKAYEDAMRQMEEREKKASEELERMMKEQKLSNVQTISHLENKQFRERKQQFNPRFFEPGRDAYYRHQFHQYMFEVEERQIQDFSIQIPLAQNVALYLYTYTNNNGIYSLADDVAEEPAKIQIFQNNNVKIVSETFHFKKYIIFQGKQHFTYAIKIINPGISRLFSLNLVHLLESIHISHTIEADMMISHGIRAASIYEELEQRIEETQKNKVMELSNQSSLSIGIKSYYFYKIIQIFVILGACFTQIKMIEKLLNSGSIV